MNPATYNDCKKEVIDAGLWLSEHGYFGSRRGTGGNVSMRINETTMVITPSSVHYQELTTEDIFLMGMDLNVIDGKRGLKPSMEAGMHCAVYRNRPDVNAIVHTHQLHGSVFGIINTPIPALFDEVALALGPVIEIIPYAFSGTAELAANAAAKVSNQANAFIIQNHGVLALGGSLDEAIVHAELIEKAAHTYCLALSTGKAITRLPQSTFERIAALKEDHIKAV